LSKYKSDQDLKDSQTNLQLFPYCLSRQYNVCMDIKPVFLDGSLLGGIQVNTKIADLIIPDDQPEGIKSELLVDKTATLSSIGVTVDITHTYRGDLNVRLTAPSGKTVVLHSAAGGSLDNLHLDLNSESFAPLSELAGEAILPSPMSEHFIGRAISAAQSNDELAAKLAQHWLWRGGLPKVEELAAELEAVTRDDVLAAIPTFVNGLTITVAP